MRRVCLRNTTLFPVMTDPERGLKIPMVPSWLSGEPTGSRHRLHHHQTAFRVHLFDRQRLIQWAGPTTTLTHGQVDQRCAVNIAQRNCNPLTKMGADQRPMAMVYPLKVDHVASVNRIRTYRKLRLLPYPTRCRGPITLILRVGPTNEEVVRVSRRAKAQIIHPIVHLLSHPLVPASRRWVPSGHRGPTNSMRLLIRRVYSSHLR